MKRFISLLLSLFLLLTLLPQTVIAESAYGTAAFTEASGKRGKEVEIHLQMQCEKGLKTIALSDFAFDDSAITLVSGQWLLQGLLSDFNVEKKNAVFAFSSNTPVSGNILKLVFRISDSADAGEYPISCNITAKEKSTSQELPVDISLTPGKVTVEAPEHVHDFSILKSDDEYHWYECANGCNEISGKAKHSGGAATCTEKAKCAVCGAQYGEPLGHSFTVLKTDGTKYWYECANGCGAISYADAIESVTAKYADTVYTKQGFEQNLSFNRIDLTVHYKNGKSWSFRYNSKIDDGLAYNEEGVLTYCGIETQVEFETAAYVAENEPAITVEEQTKTAQWSFLSAQTEIANSNIADHITFGSTTLLLLGNSTESVWRIVSVDISTGEIKTLNTVELLEEKLGHAVEADFWAPAVSFTDDALQIHYLFNTYVDARGARGYVLETKDGVRFDLVKEATVNMPEANDKYQGAELTGLAFAKDFWFDRTKTRYSEDSVTWTEFELPAAKGKAPTPYIRKEWTESSPGISITHTTSPNGFTDVFYNYYPFGNGYLINRCFGEFYGGMSDPRGYLTMNLGLYYTEDFQTFVSYDEIPLYEEIEICDSGWDKNTALVKTFVTDERRAMDGLWTNLKVFSIGAGTGKVLKQYESPYEMNNSGGLLASKTGKNAMFAGWFLQDQLYICPITSETDGTQTHKRVPFTCNHWDAQHVSDDTADYTVIMFDKKEVCTTQDNFESFLHFTLPQNILDNDVIGIWVEGDRFAVLCKTGVYYCGRDILLKESAHTHDFSVLKSNAEYHWYECANGCGTISGKAKHSGGAATCTEKAKCSVCGTEYGNALGHSYTVLKSDGEYHWYECANGCGIINGKAAHTYGEWTVTKPATETEEGEKTHKCTVCDYEQKESIPVIVPTVCTAVFSSVTGKANDTVEVTLSVNCESGVKSMAVRDFQYDHDALTLVSGEWQGSAILKDFNAENGTGAFAFAENTPVNGAVLKLSFKISETAATGDYPVSCNVVAKQKADGVEKEITVTVTPGKVTVEAAPHVHDFSVLKSDDEYHWYECANGCGEISGKAAHTYGEWTVTKEATETEEGAKERACSVCGFKQTETLPKKQTSYEGPCAYTAVKEIDGNDVIVGVYLSECNEFTSLDLTIRYNNAELFPLINAEGELTVLPGAAMDGMRPDEYRVYGNDFDDGLIGFGMYFNESYTSAETVELALIYFTLADDKVPDSITLSTDVDDVGTFDSTFSVPEQVTTVYDTDTKKLTIIAETDVMLGDVDMDGKITASDARLALRRAVDLETYPEGSKEFIACDVDHDGKVTANDARSILRAAVELEDPKTW